MTDRPIDPAAPHHRTLNRAALMLGFLTVIGPLGIDVYLPAFSAIAADLTVPHASVELSLVSYLVALSLGQAVYGPLADRFGRRPPLTAGLCLCLVACLGAALAPSLEMLVAMRFLQGMGACACVVIARAIARDIGKGHEVARLIAMMAMVQAVSPMLAPALGGMLLLHFSWRWIFGATALVVLMAVALVMLRLPETLGSARRAHGLGPAFARYGRLAADRHYMLIILAGGFASGGFFAYLSGSSFVLVTLYGLSPQQYALFFGANALLMVAAAQVSARLARRVAASVLMRAVMLVYASCAALLFAVASLGFGPIVVVTALVACLACQGMVFPIVAMRALAPYAHAAGAASALMGVVQYACGALSSSLVSALADGTAMPMVGMMLACAVISCLLAWVAGSDKA
ncbi:multidrug effflux MFS transporter [Agaricicola taiwanensis]|uniref:multidrug effflux MFS transporter n=1 Tax=Agaricicola taiwanensis TaxID=591372 RepID=UPI00166EC20A|nr:multidrug effflux MFS transporter [Agaricicola taiwanensis]